MDFSCAFQPIVDVSKKKIFSYEVLVRGKNNEPASFVFSKVPKSDLLEFDQQVRKKGITFAATLKIDCYISFNLSPRTLQDSTLFISEILQFAEQNQLRRSQLIIELTEKEAIFEPDHFRHVINSYRAQKVKIAIDDFGAGYSGLNMLVDFVPDIIKLDLKLIRSIHNQGPRQAVVKAIIQVCIDLGIDVIAEGVETLDEYHWLNSHNINLFQGFLFAKPGFECLPDVFYPD